MALTKKDILTVDDLQVEEVNVPEWGGSVLVRGLTARERDQFEDTVVENPGKNASINGDNIRSKLCVLCIVDEDGDRLFDDKDVAALGNKSAAALQRVFEVAQRLARFTNKDVEELAKN